MKRWIALTAAAAVVATPTAAFAGGHGKKPEPGSTVGNPIIVSSPDEVPEGAVEDEVSTYTDPASECADTRSWTVTVPAVDAVTHEEFRFKRDVPAVEGVQEQRYAKTIEHPEEFRYETVVVTPAVEAVPGQHYSLKGNSGIGKYEVPPTPEVNPDIWKADTEQEPHANGNGGKNITWLGTPGSGLHYASKGSKGKRDWFYYRAPVEGQEEVTEEIKVVDKEAWTETVFYDGKPGGTTDESQATWVTYAPAGYAPYGEPRWNPEPSDAYSVYYDGTEDGSLEESDAAWVKYVPTGDWTKFDTKTVTDVEAVPESVTFYAYSDGKECEDVVPPTEEPPAEEPTDDPTQEPTDPTPTEPVIEPEPTPITDTPLEPEPTIGEPGGPILEPGPLQHRNAPDPTLYVDDPGTNETLADTGSEVNVLGAIAGAVALAAGLALGYLGLGRRTS